MGRRRILALRGQAASMKAERCAIEHTFVKCLERRKGLRFSRSELQTMTLSQDSRIESVELEKTKKVIFPFCLLPFSCLLSRPSIVDIAQSPVQTTLARRFTTAAHSKHKPTTAKTVESGEFPKTRKISPVAPHCHARGLTVSTVALSLEGRLDE